MDACRHPFVMKLICPVLLPERSDGAAVLTPSALIFQRLSRDSSHTYEMNVSILSQSTELFKNIIKK